MGVRAVFSQPTLAPLRTNLGLVCLGKEGAQRRRRRCSDILVTGTNIGIAPLLDVTFIGNSVALFCLAGNFHEYLGMV